MVMSSDSFSVLHSPTSKILQCSTVFNPKTIEKALFESLGIFSVMLLAMHTQ